ncbi:uncharacterized protein LODBEIA_P05560 [Lodderomyces beijingensis]|uniref:HPt domain-containing protein n=1 Tax=Lodderomyces beijingensis TaxID=1775926 RepID=A0ABP0ZJH8_9ASCO
MAPTPEKEQKLKDSNLVDWAVFSEILQMDEDEEGFSQQLVETFVSQVEETFDTIQLYLKEKDLEQLSSTGHFLKGSAAALGLTSISSQCERIQNYGHKINFDDFELTSAPATPSSSHKSIAHKSERKSDPEENKAKAAAPSAANGTRNENDDANTKEATKKATETTSATEKSSNSSVPDESSDDFWIALIEDALAKAEDGFVKSKKALDEFFE